MFLFQCVSEDACVSGCLPSPEEVIRTPELPVVGAWNQAHSCPLELPAFEAYPYLSPGNLILWHVFSLYFRRSVVHWFQPKDWGYWNLTGLLILWLILDVLLWRVMGLGSRLFTLSRFLGDPDWCGWWWNMLWPIPYSAPEIAKPCPSCELTTLLTPSIWPSKSQVRRNKGPIFYR